MTQADTQRSLPCCPDCGATDPADFWRNPTRKSGFNTYCTGCHRRRYRVRRPRRTNDVRPGWRRCGDPLGHHERTGQSAVLPVDEFRLIHGGRRRAWACRACEAAWLTRLHNQRMLSDPAYAARRDRYVETYKAKCRKERAAAALRRRRETDAALAALTAAGWCATRIAAAIGSNAHQVVLWRSGAVLPREASVTRLRKLALRVSKGLAMEGWE